VRCKNWRATLNIKGIKIILSLNEGTAECDAAYLIDVYKFQTVISSSE
jgi:hypothetical protein